ncbi:beta-carotene ketolase CrtW [Nostoc sp. TCL26-01]|uniref:beta-carotene ketolase CrtW n=1 Tax=Nostoc sp. TCL26-01 TaxID=2576904 RepID=UPI00211834D0|nr:fatty acid desaturase [Nostoc sp. TCL26-01]
MINYWGYEVIKCQIGFINSINKGIFIAGIIIGIWLISLILLLSLDISHTNTVLIGLAMFWQTFLYTGLFITAHDAMHGTVFPQNLKLNHFIGKISLLLYGLLSYEKMLIKHLLHHKYPGSNSDPDYYDRPQQNGFLWYLNFLKSYWQWRQIIGLTILFQATKHLTGIPQNNLILFWSLPAVLSSIQLFYFGTFLPHKKPENGHTNIHCTQSIAMPIFWSFITCYHFGYHQEHHENPHIPWWKLPEVYQQARIENQYP